MIIRDDHIYTCDSCHYSFPADEQPQRCPDCEKTATRLDTEIETEDYYRVRAEIKAEIKALNAG